MVAGGGSLAQGVSAMLDPNYSASTDALTFDITDDDIYFGGNTGTPDATQTAVVTDALGNTVASGPIRLGNVYTFFNGTTTIQFYEVFVNGTLAGYVSNNDLQPGITSTVTAVSTTTQTSVTYASLANTTHEQAANTTFLGGNGEDSIVAGAGNDTLYAYGGNDRLFGGTGNDLLDGGEGNDTLSGGLGNDIFYGGTGDDRFVMEAGDGNDTIYGGGQGTGDVLDATGLTTGLTLTYGAAGSGTLSGGSGTDSFFELERATLGSGNDTMTGSTAPNGWRAMTAMTACRGWGERLAVRRGGE